MSKLLDYLKAAGGEASLMTKLGFWRQAVSGTVDQIGSTVDNLVSLVALITGGGLLPATGTTTGSRPLSGYVTALLQTGDEVFVQGINELYYFDASSALAADQLYVVNAVGPGQFIRSNTIVQTDWYVDAVAGDDENPGTLAAPIQTLAELTKRFHEHTILPSMVTLNITCTGNFVEALDLHFDSPGATAININFPMTTVDTGTIGTYTSVNAAGGVRSSILDTGQDFTTYKRTHRIRSTSGAASGSVTHIGSVVALTTANIGQFSSSVPATTNPVNGTTYAIESYTSSVTGFEIGITGLATCTISGMRVAGAASGTARCKYSCGTTFLNARMFGCQFDHSLGGGISVAGLYRLISCSNVGTTASFIVTDGTMSILNQCHFGQTTVTNCWVVAQANLHDGDGTRAVGLSIGANTYWSDISQHGFFGNINGNITENVRVDGFARWNLGSNFWGAAGNTVTNALRVRNGSGVTYSTLPTSTGATPGLDVVLANAAAIAWAAVPAIAAAPDNAYVNVRQ